MRITAAATIGCLSLIGGLAIAADAQAVAQRYELNIPKQTLDTALKELAHQTGLQIASFSDMIDGSAIVGPVSGTQSAQDALETLLKPQGLTYKVVGSRTIAVVNPKEVPVTPPSASRTDTAAITGGRDSFWTRLRLAQLARAEAASGAPAQRTDRVSARGPALIEEIIVTAQKKEERLQDVPMSITALSGDELVRSQSHRLEDYVGKVPGLTLVGYNGLGNQLVIRGVSSGSVPINGSVATYIDETPFTTQGPFAGSYISAPNLDTFDIQRIEVLRGPQGTLYGANALAGLMKYVTNAPDRSGFQTTVEAGASSVEDGGTGYELRGMVNVPLSDETAIRLVAYDNHYPGFVDDPSRGLQDTNDSRISGGRASLLYQPSDDFSIRLSAIYQERQWDDYPNVDVDAGTLARTHGGLVQEKFIDNAGRAITEVFNATLNWDLGFGKVVSTTSYYAHKPKAIYTYPVLNELFGSLFGEQFAGASVQFEQRAKAVTQELRLASPDNERLNWQIGGYFTNESAHQIQNLRVVDVTTHEIAWDFPTVIGDFHIPVSYQEYAGFANVTYRFAPAIDASLGARYSKNEQTFHETQLGLFGGPDLDSVASENVVTYSGDLRWRVTPASMVYARIASGFVPGGPNLTFAGADLPSAYESSTTLNYEVGIKSSLLDQRVTLELSVFDIEWRDIQLLANFNGLSGITNGGKAQSRGAEWNLTYVPMRGLTLNFNGSYTDAHLTEALPASVNGQVGDSLPAVPKWQSSASADYVWPLFGDFTGLAGANWRYSGTRQSDFIVGSPRQNIPSFNIFDMRAGIETQRWSLALYVKNVANEHPLIYVQPLTLAGGLGPQEGTLYSPRTIGATVTARFK